MSRGSDYGSEQRLIYTGDFLAGRLRSKLSNDDLQYIESLVSDERSLLDGQVLLQRGEFAQRSAILVDGIMFRTIQAKQRRFIVGVNVPGDFVDLHGFALKRLDHSIVAAGSVRVGLVDHSRIETVMRERPSVARAMWFATLLDAAIHRKWIQMLAQLDAPRRIVHIYCELQMRLALIGRPAHRTLRMPFTQLDLADMCGVSVVHANRAISKMREMGLGQIRRGTLYTDDWEALRDYAQFDASYLYGDGPLKLNESWS